MTLEQIKSKLADSQQRLAQIDIPAASARTASLEAVPSTGAEARTIARCARNELTNLERERTQLQREIERLSGMVYAEKRIGQAEASAAASADLVTSSAAAVDAANKTLATIDGFIQREQAAFEATRDAAAADLLATIKAGGDAGKVATPNLDKVATLELAREEARQELVAAEAAHSAARSQASAAQKRLAEARAGATGLNHEIAFEAYIDALVDHQVAHAVAYRQGFYPDSYVDAAQPRVMKALEALGL